jgi:CRP-like cAMP-binding protein
MVCPVAYVGTWPARGYNEGRYLAMAGKQNLPSQQNGLLGLLPLDVQRRLSRDFETPSLALKEVLFEPNERIDHVYFPLSSVLSMVATTHNGVAVEVATIGNEGMLGVPLFLGVDSAPLKAFAQVSGETLRMGARAFRQHVQREPKLAGVLRRYTQALMVQIAQGTVCNRAHSIEQRCCRWLLMTNDRVGTSHFVLTQEFLALMLGVRRATVSEAAAALQGAGLIQYRRGLVNIVNRRGLEQRACECYRIIRDEYARLLA